MIPEGSRYEQADRMFARSHVYDARENPVFEDTTPPTLRFQSYNRETTYLVTTLPLPPTPPAEYYVKERENFPFLAFKFFEDSRVWWRIAEVNPHIWYPLDVTSWVELRDPEKPKGQPVFESRAGAYIRIPS